jgi:hypothetical protein
MHDLDGASTTRQDPREGSPHTVATEHHTRREGCSHIKGGVVAKKDDGKPVIIRENPRSGYHPKAKVKKEVKHGMSC